MTLSCEVNRIINAPIEDVFDAWTDAEMLKQWHYPDQMVGAEVESDDIVGGSYSISMVAPDGSKSTAVGVYKEIDRPHKLVFTWSWVQGGPDAGDTQVTIVLKSLGSNKTDLTLTHEFFEVAEVAEGHRLGWESTIAKLANLLEQSNT